MEKPVQIVTELMAEGYIPETPERQQLRDGGLSPSEAARVADAAIAELTGDAAEEASFVTVMMAAWGSFEDWSPEHQAWYSQVMEDVGYETEGHTRYVLPTSEMTAEDAVEIAKQEIIRVFGMKRSLIDQYRSDSSFQIPESAAPGDTKAYWYVCFTTWGTKLNEDEVPFTGVDMFVDPDTGKLRDSLEDFAASIKAAEERRQSPVRQALSAFYASVGETGNLTEWSLEHKARWSAEMAPLIKGYQADHPGESMFNWYELASNDFVYGLPDDRALPQDAAQSAAREALRTTYHLSDDALDLMLLTSSVTHRTKIYYDVTDPERPLWKFFFNMPTIYEFDETLAARAKALFGTKYGDSPDYDQFYKVEINAYTGEVVRTLNLMFMPDTLEGFKACV